MNVINVYRIMIKLFIFQVVVRMGHYRKGDFCAISCNKSQAGGKVGAGPFDPDVSTPEDIQEDAKKKFSALYQNFDRDADYVLCFADGSKVEPNLPTGEIFSLRNAAELFGTVISRLRLFLCKKGKSCVIKKLIQDQGT